MTTQVSIGLGAYLTIPDGDKLITSYSTPFRVQMWGLDYLLRYYWTVTHSGKYKTYIFANGKYHQVETGQPMSDSMLKSYATHWLFSMKVEYPNWFQSLPTEISTPIPIEQGGSWDSSAPMKAAKVKKSVIDAPQ